MPGSHLVLSHVADLHDDPVFAAQAEATRVAAEVYQQLVAPFVLRTPQGVEDLFAGWDLVPPGIVAARRCAAPAAGPPSTDPHQGRTAAEGARRPARRPGVHTYIAIAAGAFVVAVIPPSAWCRRRRAPPSAGWARTPTR